MTHPTIEAAAKAFFAAADAHSYESSDEPLKAVAHVILSARPSDAEVQRALAAYYRTEQWAEYLEDITAVEMAEDMRAALIAARAKFLEELGGK